MDIPFTRFVTCDRNKNDGYLAQSINGGNIVDAVLRRHLYSVNPHLSRSRHAVNS